MLTREFIGVDVVREELTTYSESLRGMRSSAETPCTVIPSNSIELSVSHFSAPNANGAAMSRRAMASNTPCFSSHEIPGLESSPLEPLTTESQGSNS